MARYIDADLMKENHLMSDDCNNCEQNPKECQYNYIYTKMDFCEWIDDEPTADVVEIVRCKDCRYFAPTVDWYECEFHEQLTMPDNYCSFGERGTNEF